MVENYQLLSIQIRFCVTMYSFLGQYVYHSQFEWHVYACVMYSINVRYGKSNELIGVQIIITLNRGKIARHSQTYPNSITFNTHVYTCFILVWRIIILCQRCEIKLLLTSKWWLLPTVFPFFYKQKWWHFEIQGMPLKPLSHIFTLPPPNNRFISKFLRWIFIGCFLVSLQLNYVETIKQFTRFHSFRYVSMVEFNG